MSNDIHDNAVWLIITAVAILLIGFGTGYSVGHMDCRYKMCEEAVKRGFAEKLEGFYGGKIFRWKETEQSEGEK